MTRLARIAAGSLVGAAGALMIRAHLLYMRPVHWLNVDEGYASALGLRLLHDGGLPYVSGVSQRGPVMYWLYALVQGVGGEFSVAALRYAALGASLVTILLAAGIGLALGTPVGGGAAALAITWSLTAHWAPPDGMALNGELLALPFLLGHLLAVVLALRGTGRARAWFVTAGALAALAAFTKQSFAIHVLVTFAWIALHHQRGHRRAPLLAFAAGGAAVAAAVLAPYLAGGHLGAFWYYAVRWGREVYLAPVSIADVGHVVWLRVVVRAPFALLACAAIAATIASALARVRSTRETRAILPGAALLAHVLAAIPAATFTGRDFGHYFLPLDVLTALLAGHALETLARSIAADRRVAYGLRGAGVGAAAVLAIVTVTGQSAQLRALESRPWYRLTSPPREPIGAWLRAHTAPEDRVFVWGFRADVHVNAHRLPASRFVYALYPSGVAPWYPQPRDVEARRIAPASHEQLIADLEASRAEIVIDAGSSLMDRWMVDYPALRAYLDANFCYQDEIAHAPIYGSVGPVARAAIYRRRHDDGAPCRAIPQRPITPR